MSADDASSAEMRRPPDRDADPLALDDDTVERLLSGTLPPAQAPPGFAKVAELLAAAAAAPSPAELAGQEAVLAELRAVTRGRPPAVRSSRRARTSRRRRRAGLAVVVVVGALVTGGVAGAATGHLPGPVREAARSILGTTDGGTPSTSTQAGQPPAPVKRPAGSGGGLGGARPGVSTGRGPGAAGAGPAAAPNLEGLCRAVMYGNGAELGGKLDATAFEVLARAAGGEDKVAAFCEDLLPGDQKLKEPKTTKDTKKPKDQEQPSPPGNADQGQGGPSTSTGSGDGQGQDGPQPEGQRAP
jgi:hypothetical protein